MGCDLPGHPVMSCVQYELGIALPLLHRLPTVLTHSASMATATWQISQQLLAASVTPCRLCYAATAHDKRDLYL